MLENHRGLKVFLDIGTQQLCREAWGLVVQPLRPAWGRSPLPLAPATAFDFFFSLRTKSVNSILLRSVIIP